MILNIQNLYFGYTPKHWEIDDCSFALERGRHTAIIGPNGSGKSTLFRLLIRLLKPAKGDIHLDEQSFSHHSQRELAKKIAFVPQDNDVLFPLSAWEMVMMGRSPYLRRFALETDDDRHKTEAAMRLTETLAFAKRPVTELSGGERERLLFARALAQDTPLLLLDEPYTHLDLHYQWKMHDWIAELVAEKSKTVLSVLHQIDHAQSADTVMLWNRGRPLRQGPARDLLDKSVLMDLFSPTTKVSDGLRVVDP